MLAHALSALAFAAPMDEDLNPLTRNDVVVVQAPDYPRITVALTRGGTLVALMLSHAEGGKHEAYIEDGSTNMVRIEV